MPAPRDIALGALGAAGAIGAGAAVWGIGIERYLFTVRRHELAVLPVGAAPLRVLHVSDLHMAPWQRRKQQWVGSLAELSPDLIVNTGDNMGHERGLDGLRAAFEPLRGIPGVFVHGSNDHAAPSPRNPFKYFLGPSKSKGRAEEPIDTAALDEYFTEDLGWHHLNNDVASLSVGGVRIDTFGVSDAHRGWDDMDALPEPLKAMRADAGEAPLLGVSHAPYRRVLDRFTDLGADAILAGHTHGGQVRVPFSRKALVANCDIPLDQARGLTAWTHADRRIPLNVSAGVGHSIYAPVRFGCRPEVSLITLVARPGTA